MGIMRFHRVWLIGFVFMAGVTAGLILAAHMMPCDAVNIKKLKIKGRNQIEKVINGKFE